MKTKQYDGNTKVDWKEVGWMPKDLQFPRAQQMKLSGAIRLGCTMSPEIKNKMGYYGECGGTCAVGAAHEAVVGRAKKNEGICWAVAETLGIPKSVISDAVMYFSSHTREQVADWLEARGD